MANNVEIIIKGDSTSAVAASATLVAAAARLATFKGVNDKLKDMQPNLEMQ